MAEVYYELSPYSFLNNNPISNIDPTGAVTLSGQAAKNWLQNKKDEIASKPRKRKEREDPIYDRRGNQIGDDGKTDGNAYLVKGKVMRDVKRATKAGEYYTGSLDESRNVFHVPTDNLLEDVITSVNNTIASGDSADTRLEHGAHALIGDVTARHWDPGYPKVTEIKDDGSKAERWSITPFKINGRNQPGTGSHSDIRFVWHTQLNSSVPSRGDRSSMRDWTSGGFTRNAFLINVNNMKVTFYNQRGSLLKIDYNVFLKIGRRQ